MTHQIIHGKENKKIPCYVPIYNMLYADILHGVYPYGTQLPGEHTLTQKYHVSRNTLRQALTILSQDGLIVKQQGKGSVVTYNPQKTTNPKDKIFNPMTECALQQIDEIDLTYNYGPGTEVCQEKLSLKPSEIILASNCIYYGRKKPLGHSFIQIPVKYIEHIPVDLHQESEVSSLVNRLIFLQAQAAKLTFRWIKADAQLESFLKTKEGSDVIYLEQILFNQQHHGIARCKFYFLPTEFDLTFLI